MDDMEERTWTVYLKAVVSIPAETKRQAIKYLKSCSTSEILNSITDIEEIVAVKE
jgi:hypothetical protein